MGTKLGDYVRTRRTELGLGLNQAAGLAEVPPSAWSRIETGRITEVTPQRLAAMAGVLDLLPEDLYEQAGFPVTPFLPSLREARDLPPDDVERLQQDVIKRIRYYRRSSEGQS